MIKFTSSLSPRECQAQLEALERNPNGEFRSKLSGRFMGKFELCKNQRAKGFGLNQAKLYGSLRPSEKGTLVKGEFQPSNTELVLMSLLKPLILFILMIASVGSSLHLGTLIALSGILLCFFLIDLGIRIYTNNQNRDSMAHYLSKALQATRDNKA